MTVTGETMLPDATILAYANIDDYTDFFATIPLSAITGNECPFVLTGIPDGTTVILLRDPNSACCLYITIICCDYKQFQHGLCFEFQDYESYYFQDQPQ
jgi:hypothetical protein